MFAWPAQRPWLCWVAAALCFWTVSTRLDLPRDFVELSVTQWLGWTILYGATAFLLLLPGVFGPQDQGLLRSLLRTRVLVGIGVVSYGLYLWHELWLDMYFEWFDTPVLHARFLVVLGFAGLLGLLAGATSWRLVEQPARRLRAKRLLRGTQPVEKRADRTVET